MRQKATLKSKILELTMSSCPYYYKKNICNFTDKVYSTYTGCLQQCNKTLKLLFSKNNIGPGGFTDVQQSCVGVPSMLIIYFDYIL